MSDTCAICLESNGRLYTTHHDCCIFQVHKSCFYEWYIQNRTCIICRAPVTDITRPAIFVGSVMLSFTIVSYIAMLYCLIYKIDNEYNNRLAQ